MFIEVDTERCPDAPLRIERVYGNHQGLGNRLILVLWSESATVDRRIRRGGMLSYYERVAE